MKIEQPEYLRPIFAESFRRESRIDDRRFLFLLPIVACFPPAFTLALTWLTGVGPVSGRRLVGLALATSIVLAGALRAIRYMIVGGSRSAEIHGDRVRVKFGWFHQSFRKAQVRFCTIEPDIHFPQYAVLHVAWLPRLSRRLERFWMMVEDIKEGERFRREVAEHPA